MCVAKPFPAELKLEPGGGAAAKKNGKSAASKKPVNRIHDESSNRTRN
jgi:hypothetical protein